VTKTWAVRLVAVAVTVNLMLLGVLIVRAIGQASDGHRAICALRGDLERRRATAAEFLERYPNGVAGIPPAAIEKSRSDQLRTIRALSDANCTEDELGP